MSVLAITNGGSNPLLTRSPICLTTVADRIIPPNYQEAALCGFIAATNIESISGYEEWSCTTSGIPSTDSCAATAWSGVTCDSGLVIDIGLNGFGLAGNF